MSEKSRKPFIVLGALGCIAPLICILGIWLYFGGWTKLANRPANPPAPVPQLSLAISAQNMERVQILYEISEATSVSPLVWSPDSRLLAAGSHVLDMANGREWLALDSPDALTSISFSTNNQLLVAGSAGGITIWDVRNKSKLRSMDAPQEPIRQIVFSPDAQSIIAAERSVVESWDVATGRKLRTVDASNGALYSIGQKILVWSKHGASRDLSVTLSEFETGRDWWTVNFNSDDRFPAALSHDGRMMAIETWIRLADAPAEYTLELLDTSTGKGRRKLTGTVRHDSCPPSSPISFSTDDTVIALVPYLQPYPWEIWSIDNRPSLENLQNDARSKLDAAIGCVAFSPNGRFLAASGDGTIQLWGIKP